MVRSALAVLAGFVSMALLVMITTALAVRFVLRRPLGSMGSRDASPAGVAYLATNVTTSVLAALVGGYVTALTAERDRVAHGLVLAAVVVVMSLVSARQSGAAQPRWYRILLLVGMPVLTVVGAVLCSSVTVSP